MNYFTWLLVFVVIAIPFSYYPNKGEAPSGFRKRRLDIVAGNIIGAGSSLVGLTIALIIWGITMYGIVYGLTIEAVLAVALMPIYFGFYRKKYYQQSDSGDVAVFGFALSTGLMVITLIALLIVGQVNNYSGLSQTMSQSSSSPIGHENPVVSAVVTSNQWEEYSTATSSFKVLFPGGGQEAHDFVDDAGVPPWGSLFPSILRVYQANEYPYWVDVITYPSTTDTSKPNSTLRAMLEWEIQHYGATTSTLNLLTFEGYPAIDYVFLTPEGVYARGRNILVGHTIYEVLENDSAGGYSASDYEKFVNSFQLQPITESQSRLPKGIDGMLPILTGIQSINTQFKTCTADQLFTLYSTPINSTDTNGTLIFFDYDNNGTMDFVTTNLGNGSMLYAASASASIETKPINYLDEEVFAGGGKKYYRQLDWEKIMAVK